MPSKPKLGLEFYVRRSISHQMLCLDGDRGAFITGIFNHMDKIAVKSAEVCGYAVSLDDIKTSVHGQEKSTEIARFYRCQLKERGPNAA